jgi:hypothetical protein
MFVLRQCLLASYLNAPVGQKNIGEKDACLHLLGTVRSPLLVYFCHFGFVSVSSHA